MINPVVNRRNISQIFAIAYFSKLSCVSKLLQCIFLNFMRIIYDILFLEAIVPNGLYNIFQINVMKKETVKRYAKKNYYNNGIAYENTVENIKGKV